MIHYDPIVVGDLELDAMRTKVNVILHTIDQRLSIHDFRMVKSDGHIKLIFDMVVPSDLMGQKNTVKETLDGKLNENSPNTVYTVITFDPAF